MSLRERYELKPESERAAPIFSFSSPVNSVDFFPNTLHVPESGITSPRIDFIVVLFPAPFLPTRPVMHPGLTSRVTSSENDL